MTGDKGRARTAMTFNRIVVICSLAIFAAFLWSHWQLIKTVFR